MIIEMENQVSIQSLEAMTQDQLMKLRLCDIKLTLPKSGLVVRSINQLSRELKAKKIFFKPHIWVSDEWFSPDGVAGFAIPFYLLSPRLLKLEKKMTGLAEGSHAPELMRLLRHETGHALDNAFHLRKSKKRQSIFGMSSQKYPLSYKPDLSSRHFVKHLDAGYAQSHPDEDWAETFAVWMTPRSHWQSRYQSSPAISKLQLVDSVMESITDKTPKNNTVKEVESIQKNKMTLADYYKKRQKQLKVRQESPIYKKAKILIKSSGNLPAWRFIKENEHYIAYEVAKKSLLPQYKVNKLLSDFKMACKNDSFTLSNTQAQRRANLKKIVGLLTHPQVTATQSRVQM
jgi:hypothetical protein